MQARDPTPAAGAQEEPQAPPPLLVPERPLCPHCWRLPSGPLRKHGSGMSVCPACNLHSHSHGGQLRRYSAEQQRQHAEQAQQALQQRREQQEAAAAASSAVQQQAPATQQPERRPKRKAAAGPSSASGDGGSPNAALPHAAVRQPKPAQQPAKRSKQPRNVYQALAEGGVEPALVHALFWRCAVGGLGDKEAVRRWAGRNCVLREPASLASHLGSGGGRWLCWMLLHCSVVGTAATADPASPCA